MRVLLFLPAVERVDRRDRHALDAGEIVGPCPFYLGKIDFAEACDRLVGIAANFGEAISIELFGLSRGWSYRRSSSICRFHLRSFLRPAGASNHGWPLPLTSPLTHPPRLRRAPRGLFRQP